MIMHDSLPVFAYWHSEDRSLLAEFLADWRTHFPDLRVIGDADVEPLIGRILPSYVELYRRVRFPTTKANIARLAYLHKYGGLYVDCHCGLRSARGVRELFEQLQRYELVMWENSYITWPRFKETMKVMSTILLARARSPIVLEFLLRGLANLEVHSKREASEGMVEYSPWYLCGAGSYLEHLCVPGSANTQLKSEFTGRIFFTELDGGPIAINQHVAYKLNPKQHWSYRRLHELLFDSTDSSTDETSRLEVSRINLEREAAADVPAMREELQRSSDALAEAGAYARHLEADLRARDAALAEADQASQATRVERDAAVAVAETARAERDAAAAEAEAAWAEHDAAAAAVGELIKAAEAVRVERDAAAAALAEAGSYARHVEADLAATTAYARHVEADLAATTAALSQAGSYARSLNAQLTAVLNSTSWRLSWPLRAIVNYWRTRRVLRRRTPLPACVPVQDRSLAQTSVPAVLTPPQSSPSSPIEAEHKARLTSNATANLEVSRSDQFRRS
jgi:Glycosyltransferase sugar-binding region containing DXD motif